MIFFQSFFFCLCKNLIVIIWVVRRLYHEENIQDGYLAQCGAHSRGSDVWEIVSLQKYARAASRVFGFFLFGAERG